MDLIRRSVLALLICSILVFLPSVAGAQGNAADPWKEPVHVKARVLRVDKPASSGEGQGAGFKTQLVTVKVTSGEHKDEVLQVEHNPGDSPAFRVDVKAGDRVLLLAHVDGGKLTEAFIESHARDVPLVTLTAVFFVTLIALGGLKGIKAALSLSFTVFSIIKKGYNPVLLAVLVSAAASGFTLAAIGGFNRKTLAAIVGTVGGVSFAGLLAYRTGIAANLTGFATEEVAMLAFIPQGGNFNFRGLLFAGIIIGALGAVMDVGMSVSSAMEGIWQANPTVTTVSLVRSGMNVGRDLMGTMSNTLVLAYTGGSLPLLMLFMAYNTPMIKVVSLEMIATEIIRSLAGSTGLLLAVPLTAVSAGIALTWRRSDSAGPGSAPEGRRPRNRRPRRAGGV